VSADGVFGVLLLGITLNSHAKRRANICAEDDMFIHRTTNRVLFSVAAALLLMGPMTGFAQDAQRQAAARVARERAAADEQANASPNRAEDADRDSTTAPNADLTRRPGERTGAGTLGESQILGMSVKEAGRGGVKVVEVTAASPAFDAGIRQGDEIVSFNGFNANTYRKWIDGMRRLARDAVGDSMLPVVVTRRGEQLAMKVRVPQSNTSATITLPTGPPEPQQPPQVLNQNISVEGVPAGGVGGWNDVNIANVGPFGDFFGGATNPSERAMAQIFRVGGSQPRPASGGTASGSTANGARIGLAGFRNDASGMLVMVDVGALEPGNYTVAITDPSVLRNTQTGAGQSVPNQATGGSGSLPQSPPAAGDRGGRAVPENPTGRPPINPEGATGQPQGSSQPANIPRNVLAQVAEESQPTAGSSGTTIPASGQTRPLTAPATGEVNPSSTLPTGQSAANQELSNQINQNNAARSSDGRSSNLPMQQIGTLTVDQSGTGRMQNVVEGSQVKAVVGQAIAIYSQTSSTADQKTTLPPNLDPTADPGDSNTDAAQSRGGQTSNGGPVAAGVIRLIGDRRPGPAAGTATEDAFGSPSNTPAAGGNPTRQN
jgi:membrane-associated protease RseP (regulator of RpoE activity)